MTRAELKAMGVRVYADVSVDCDPVHSPLARWCVWVGDPGVLLADRFPTRRVAEQYARQIRKAMRGG